MDKNKILEFPGGSAREGSSIVIAVARVTVVAQVWPLTQALPYAMGAAKKIHKNKKNKNMIKLPQLKKSYWENTNKN